MRNCLIVIFSLWMMLHLEARADIVTDGSLGIHATLTGNTLAITPELGQRVGNNLFHSFQEFNLDSYQTAIFSGSSDLQNIISRVTGNSSFIDGTIRSTIPHADIYLLNNHGIVFGEHAQLDVPGSFIASTADSVIFRDGQQFNTNLSQNSVLSVAPPESFGFLSNSPAPIQIQNSQLAVEPGNTLSLIGGGLYFSGQPVAANPLSRTRIYKPPVDTLIFPNYSTGITATAGEIKLISVSSLGVVNPNIANPSIEQGAITLNHTRISATGEHGGNIWIRGGLLQLNDAQIESQTLQDTTGGDITIQATDVILRGEQDFSAIVTSTQGTGQGGNLFLTARNLHISGGGFVLNGSYGLGNSGITVIRLSDDLTVEGTFLKQFFIPSGIISAAHTTTETAGNGGDIDVAAKNIRLTHGGEIAVTTYGGGHSGNIRVAVDNLYASGLDVVENPNNPDPTKPWFVQSGISSSSFAGSDFLESFKIPTINKAGNAGNIDLVAKNIVLQDEGLIISDGHQGNAGKIDIHTQQLSITNLGLIGGSTWGEGKGGLVDIVVSDNLIIANQYELADPEDQGGIFTNSLGKLDTAGDGGDVLISAGTINMSGRSIITTATINASGGNIEIISPRLLYMDGAEISTSVSGGKGNGGNITVQNSQVVVLNDAILRAQATEGKGGNIRVAAQRFIRSPYSIINAASLLGINGDISIDSPLQDLTNELFPLSTSFLDATTMLVQPCFHWNRSDLPDYQRPPLSLVSRPMSPTRATPEQWIPSY